MSDAGPRPLGERLRAAREARGASLSDVADQIRIRSVYLTAMEQENWDAIGAPVYVRGFLRTYARYLKLDPEQAVAEFNATLPEPPAPKSVERERSPASRRSGLLLIWTAGTIAVLLVAFVFYNELTLRSERSAVATTTTPAPLSPASPTPPALAPSPTPGAGGPSSLALVFSA